MTVGSAKDWEKVSTSLTRRCAIVEVWGPTDSGRTTFALTAGGPIAFAGFYEKRDGIIQDAARRTEVHELKFRDGFRGDTDEVMELASAEADRFEQVYYGAYDWARSVIVDTHGSLWETIQLARLGTLNYDDRSNSDQKRGQLVYSDINSRYKAMLNEFRIRAEKDNRTNLILIGKAKDEYAKKPGSNAREATGRIIPAGQKDTGYSCDVRLRMKRSKEGMFSAVIEKPWFNNAVRGLEIDSESGMLTFPRIMSIITSTDASEWGEE